MQPTPASDGILSRLVELAVTGSIGFLAAIVAFRTQFALLGRDVEQNKLASEQRDTALKTSLEQQAAAHTAEMTAIRTLYADHLSDIDRRQRVSLQIMADVAKHLGIDGRFSDALVRYLSEEMS